MENGGMNLHDFAKTMGKLRATAKNCKIMENFWIECHRLFLGLSVFLKENIMHHDLKAQNIVYNPKTGRAAFIDFGLMRPLDVQKNRILRSEKLHSFKHWSYPVETIFYHKDIYTSDALKLIILDDLKNDLNGVYDNNFLNCILPLNNTNDDVVTRVNFIDALFYTMRDFIENDTKNINYNDFLDKSLETFDLYGMAMGLMYVFKKTYHLLRDFKSKIDYVELFKHLWWCIRPDYVRYTVEDALNMYEERVLGDILKENNVIFVNHIPQKIESPPKLTVPKMSDTALEKSMEEQDEKLFKKTCPAGKVLNPFTGRCVKECKPNQQRDEKFRCKTQKLPKQEIKSKQPVIKICPDNKELNPHTTRCVKKCKPNQQRDEKFHCKTQKLPKQPKVKICPSDKILNPKTNRCKKTNISVP
jgi:serine/threonine protein kinase